MMKPRLISKEHAKVVADAGGVVGVWTKLADSMKEFVEGIQAMVDAIGVDHVGIGSDTDLLSTRVGQGTNQSLAGPRRQDFSLRLWPKCCGRVSQSTTSEKWAEATTAASLAKLPPATLEVFGFHQTR